MRQRSLKFRVVDGTVLIRIILVMCPKVTTVLHMSKKVLNRNSYKEATIQVTKIEDFNRKHDVANPGHQSLSNKYRFWSIKTVDHKQHKWILTTYQYLVRCIFFFLRFSLI